MRTFFGSYTVWARSGAAVCRSGRHASELRWLTAGGGNALSDPPAQLLTRQLLTRQRDWGPVGGPLASMPRTPASWGRGISVIVAGGATLLCSKNFAAAV